MIPDQWYAVYESSRLRKKPVAVRRMNERLVLWRDTAGTPHAMHDRCPHRGAALSQGKVQGDSIECPYHGFRFSAEGDCTLMPCEGPKAKAPAGMTARAYTVREEHGLIWLFWGEARGELPELPWFDGQGRGGASGAFEWPIHYVRAIESNFDLHHTPFVHRSTRVARPGFWVDPITVETKDTYIKLEAVLRREDQAPEDGLAFRVEFKAPGTTLLYFAPKAWAVITDCPIDNNSTWRHASFQQDYVRIPGLRQALNWILLQADWKWFQYREDLRIIEQLQPRLPHMGQDRLVRADAGTAAYLKLHRRLLEEAAPASVSALRGS